MKVGDYVRTEIGGITKIEKLTLPKEPSDCLFVKFEDEPYSFKYKPWETIDFKSSPNIIDLIEVGDYVNGIQINERIGDSVWHFSVYGDEDECFESKDIKTIVTKERFKSIEYKIGE